jgi:ribosomal protein S15P/S13E
MDKQLQRDESPISSFSSVDLAQVERAVDLVRRRLRLQAAVQGLVFGLIAAATVMLLALSLYRFGVLSRSGLRTVTYCLPLGVVLTVLASALRRIDSLWVASLIDKSHTLSDRLSSALQLARGHTAQPKTDTARGLVELAIADAARASASVTSSQAAPWKRPLLLPVLCGLLVLNGLVALVRLDRLKAPTGKTQVSATEPSEATLRIDPELIGPEKEELLQKLAEAEQRGDHETAQLLRDMLGVLSQVERGELTRQQAFDRLSEIEQRILQGSDATLAELERRLHQAGNELSESKLTKELGKALSKDDVEKAKAELKELADKALAKAAATDKQQMAEAFERAARALQSRPDDKAKADPSDPSKQKDEWQSRGKSEELIQKLNELSAEQRKVKEQLEKNPQDKELQRKLDELAQQEKKLSEQLKEERAKEQQQKEQQQKELEQQQKELREEERRLKKKLQENPQDEESERRLKKTQRQLEQLEQRLQENSGSGERRLQRLGDEKQPEYQNEARKLMSEMEREQQKFEDEIRKLKAQKQKLEEDISKLKEQLKKNPQDQQAKRELERKQQQLSDVERQLREKQEAQRQMEQLQRDLQQAAEQMRQSMEKMTPEQRQAMEELAKDISRYQDEVRKLQKQKQGQKQNIVTLDQIKQVLRRLGRSGQGQGQQGQGQKDMQDFKRRAGGQGDGDGQTLVLGGSGQDGQSTIVLMPGQGQSGQGQSGQGQGDKGNQNGQGGPGQGQSGDKPGTNHDPNFVGDVTQIESKRKLTRVYGKEGAGPTRSQTILGAAEKGFATQAYRKVYGDYTSVSEEVMSKQRVPPGYRFYVKRYFQMIKPRGN